MGVRILKTAVYLPRNIITNEELEKKLGLESGWIKSRTGIESRHWAEEDENILNMAIRVVENILDEDQGSRVDKILFVTSSEKPSYMPYSIQLASAFGMQESPGVDIVGGFMAFLHALDRAIAAIEAGKAEKILIVASEMLSKHLDWEDPSTLPLFGDGAGGVLLVNDHWTHVSYFKSIPGTEDYLFLDENGTIQMNGTKVYRTAVEGMEEVSKKLLEKAKSNPSELELVVPHQANLKIIERGFSKLGIPKERIFIDLVKHGNTGSASIPIALHHALQKNTPRSIMMVGVGSGMNYGGVLMWEEIR